MFYVFFIKGDPCCSVADGLPVVSDEVDIEALTDIERQNLKNVLSKISTFQTKLSYDFLGTAAGR